MVGDSGPRSLQPHEGSSETGDEITGKVTDTNGLQPHEGSSETSRENARRGCDEGFNPTRVRLKQELADTVEDTMSASTPRGFV